MRESNRGGGAVGEKPRQGHGALRILGRILLTAAVFIAITCAGAYATLWVICRGPSPAASDLFVSTILETGQMKFLASWFFTPEEILDITGRNAMAPSQETVDAGLIAPLQEVGGGSEGIDPDAVTLEEISGRSFYAKMLTVNDPSRVRLATIYPWSDVNRSKRGQTLEQLVSAGDYLAGVNGGEYESDGNWGGRPKGVVVCGGDLQFNSPKRGDVLVGLSEDNILLIQDVGEMTAGEVQALVERERVRDAVSFKDIDDGNDNHFTKLIVNGKAREITGTGSGANPRTVIGQRADGAILLLVTDGRGAAGHLGATAQDLISIMLEHGAVNAANLDGGSSSAMYYNGAYEMTSVTLYYSTSSWRLPTAFVVERRVGA